MPPLDVSVLCRVCDAKIRFGEASCPGCARALDAEELDALEARWHAADPEAARAAAGIHYGRAVIAAIAALALIEAGVWWALADLATAALLALAVAVLFALLLVASYRWPLPSTALAALVYLALWIRQLASSPFAGLSLLRGLLFFGLLAGCAAELRASRPRARR
jgi:hypothetical protein